MSTLFIILLAIALGGYVITFNSLVLARQKVKEAWAGIDVQLKRRYDLIPNLVKTVKGYAKHESETLEKVTKARTDAMAVPQGEIANQATAENFLSSTLKSIFALSENYPDLKADQNFLDLQQQLTETEDQIASARRIYNGNVTTINTKIQSFPSNLVAKIHNFKERGFFELDEEEKKAVQEVPDVGKALEDKKPEPKPEPEPEKKVSSSDRISDEDL